MKKINSLFPDNRLFFYCGSILIPPGYGAASKGIAGEGCRQLHASRRLARFCRGGCAYHEKNRTGAVPECWLPGEACADA